MNYVEGFGEDVCYTREEALDYFKEQSEATELPFIFLSAGVSAAMFQETLRFAKKSKINIQWSVMRSGDLGKWC